MRKRKPATSLSLAEGVSSWGAVSFITASLWAFGGTMFGIDSFTSAKWLFGLGNLILAVKVCLWFRSQFSRRTVLIPLTICCLLVTAWGTAIEIRWVNGRSLEKAAQREAEELRQQASAGDLRGARKQYFLNFLKASNGEVLFPVRFSCSAHNEESCARAWRYLQLFSEAGWPLLLPYVQRTDTSLPFSGVVVVSSGDRDPTIPPHLGTWHEVGRSEQKIMDAFKQAGISAKSSIGPSVLPRTLVIHFGVGI